VQLLLPLQLLLLHLLLPLLFLLLVEPPFFVLSS